MDSVGICGSDVHYWTHGGIGAFSLKSPMVIGHEGAGTVQRCLSFYPFIWQIIPSCIVASDSIIFIMQHNIFSIGKRVLHLRVGDCIAIEPGYSCRKCSYCKDGCYNICRDMKFCATPPVDGNLRSLLVTAILIYQL